MNFYSDPSFFVAVALLAVPAVVLGVRERSLKTYGLVASAIMLALLFSGSLVSMAYLLLFVALSVALERLTLSWFSKDDPRAVAKYRVALALQIAPLAIYKVGVLWNANILGFLGISYITFKAVQVLIETRDGLIRELSVRDHLAFLVFFAPFTSGPIMRSRDYLAQLGTPRSRDAYLALLLRGARQMLVGAAYTFVGAALTTWAVWFAPQLIGPGTPLAELAEALLYGLNLFLDFAGYSLMVQGVGALFGVEVPDNFHAPFAATSLGDFWQRWHITLSQWLRDFVFMRVSRTLMQRRILCDRTQVACVAFMANFLLMGAWHGLTVDYLLYGLYWGVAMCVSQVWERTSFYKQHRSSRGYQLAAWAVTMIVVFVGFSIFSGQVARLVVG